MRRDEWGGEILDEWGGEILDAHVVELRPGQPMPRDEWGGEIMPAAVVRLPPDDAPLLAPPPSRGQSTTAGGTTGLGAGMLRQDLPGLREIYGTFADPISEIPAPPATVAGVDATGQARHANSYYSSFHSSARSLEGSFPADDDDLYTDLLYPTQSPPMHHAARRVGDSHWRHGITFVSFRYENWTNGTRAIQDYGSSGGIGFVFYRHPTDSALVKVKLVGHSSFFRYVAGWTMLSGGISWDYGHFATTMFLGENYGYAWDQNIVEDYSDETGSNYNNFYGEASPYTFEQVSAQIAGVTYQFPYARIQHYSGYPTGYGGVTLSNLQLDFYEYAP